MGDGRRVVIYFNSLFHAIFRFFCVITGTIFPFTRHKIFQRQGHNRGSSKIYLSSFSSIVLPSFLFLIHGSSSRLQSQYCIILDYSESELSIYQRAV